MSIPVSTAGCTVEQSGFNLTRWLNFNKVGGTSGANFTWNLDEPIRIKKIILVNYNTVVPAAGKYIYWALNVVFPNSSKFVRLFNYTILPSSDTTKFTIDVSSVQDMILPVGTQVMFDIVGSSDASTDEVNSIWVYERIENSQVQEVIKKCDLINWILGRCD